LYDEFTQREVVYWIEESARENFMASESIVVVSDMWVMFVAGDRGKPISEQAPVAFDKLEGKLIRLKGRRFYGVVVDEEYRACVAIRPDDNLDNLPGQTWVIPGGKFARRRLFHWEQQRHRIGPTMVQMRERTDFDSSRYCIEYYRSQRELLLMAPIL
jgi:hypothetical protein